MKTRILIFILFFITSYFSFSGNVDSLKQLLDNAEGQSKIEILNSLAATYDNINPVERNQYAQISYELALTSGNDSLIAIGLKNLAIGKYYLNELDSTTYYFQAALEQYKQNQDTLGISICLGNLGMLFQRNLQYDMAIDYMIEAKKYKESEKDSVGLINIIYNLVSLYYDLQDTYKALEYTKLVDYLNSTVETLPKDYKPDVWINYGAIYLRFAQQQLKPSYFENIESTFLKNKTYSLNDSALYFIDLSEFYYKKALKHYKDIGNESKVATIMKGIGNLNMTMQDFDKSYSAYNHALQYYNKIGDRREVARIYINIAYANALENNFNNSLAFYQKADSLASEFGFIDVSIRANEALYKYYLLQKEDTKALFYLEKFSLLKDSINTLTVDQQLTKLRAQETIKSKNYKIQLLEKDKEVLARERIILVISVSIILVLAILFYARFRFKSKTSKLFEAKNRELEQLNEELKHSQELLTEINNAKDKMFAIIAHDLRNPIGSLRQTAELMYDEFDNLSDEDKKEFAEGIKDSSSKVYNLMENLLTWSRSQRGKIECHPTETNLFRLVENTKDNLLHQAQIKSISIHNLTKPEAEPVIDPQLTSTILRNLLSNAIKFSDLNKSITIDCKKDAKFIEIAVRDQGVGMNASQIEKLFNLDSSNSTKGTNGEEGTGLGLLLCKEFAELQKGSLSVESKVGVGTTFIVKLPLNPDNI